MHEFFSCYNMANWLCCSIDNTATIVQMRGLQFTTGMLGGAMT